MKNAKGDSSPEILGRRSVIEAATVRSRNYLDTVPSDTVNEPSSMRNNRSVR